MNQVNQHNILLTLVVAMSFGVMQMIASHSFRVPAVILLLGSGVLLGPEFLGWVQADSLGDFLSVFVSLSLGIVLFEGGMGLNVKEYRSASSFIRRLLTVGVLVTWCGTALVLYMLLSLPFSFALLAASLVVVTGPTVIGPLLKTARLKPKLHNILTWEAVLIDPIGVFIAVLCFDWIFYANVERAVFEFVLRVVCGLAIGVVAGYVIAWVLRRRIVPEETLGIFTLVCAVLTFGISEILMPEAGLLATIAAGLVIGAANLPQINTIRRFKAEITELLIGTLFILLASRLELAQFKDFGWTGLACLACVIFIIRPLSILICTVGLNFSWNEKLFLSWFAPRGIVAASMASLFRLALEEHAADAAAKPSWLTRFLGEISLSNAAANAVLLETFTYSVIIATVVLHGISLSPLAKVLGLTRPPSKTWLVVGAHRLGRALARFINDHADHAVIVDVDKRMVADTEQEEIEAIAEDAKHVDQILEKLDGRVGYVIALTDNAELNTLVCELWAQKVGSEKVYRWASGKSSPTVEQESRGHIVWRNFEKPSLLSKRIEKGQAILSRDPLDMTEPQVLAMAKNGTIKFETIPEPTAALYVDIKPEEQE